jgi:WD40 repeat protein
VLDESAWCNDLLFTPDSSRILFAAYDGVRVWNIQSAIRTFGYIPEYLLIAPLQEKEFIFSLALSPDGSVLAVGYQDGSVRLWNMDNGEQLAVLKGHEGRVMSLAFSPDGTLLASGGTDGTVRLWGVVGE